jgi:hypothetical protein
MDAINDDFSNYWALFERPFKCTCCCLARPEMTARSSSTNYGKVFEPCTVCDPMFHVKDGNENVRWKVTADYCQCGICCRNGCGKCSEVSFYIFPASETDYRPGKEAGVIKKKFTGYQELVSDADSFELYFPKNSSPEDKLLLISTVLMIDYRFYEDGGNDQNRRRSYY